MDCHKSTNMTMPINITEFSLLVLTDTKIANMCIAGYMKGYGIKGDPYVFTDISSIPGYISFKGVHNHILIEGGTFKQIIIKFCRNIHIVNSKISTLVMEDSTDITIEGSTLSSLNLNRSVGNIYRNNKCSHAIKTELQKKQQLFPLRAIIASILIGILLVLYLFVLILSFHTYYAEAVFRIGGTFVSLIVIVLGYYDLRVIYNHILVRRKIDIIENNQFV